jgi:hypothetical protein
MKSFVNGSNGSLNRANLKIFIRKKPLFTNSSRFIKTRIDLKRAMSITVDIAVTTHSNLIIS